MASANTNVISGSDFFKPNEYFAAQMCEGSTDSDCVRSQLENFNSRRCDYEGAPFKPFTNMNCGLTGWSQQHNDCWLDSTLYAIFASKELRELFASTLMDTQHHSNPHVKEIGRLISLYLEDINVWKNLGDFDISVRNCKQILKKKLVQSILLYNKSLPKSDKITSDAALIELF